MKIFCITMVFIALSFFCDAQSLISIRFQAGGYTGAKCKLITPDSVYAVTIGENGKGSVSLPADCPAGYGKVEYNGYFGDIYLNNKDFDIMLTPTQAKLFCSFSGDGARENIYLHSMPLYSYNFDYKLDEKEFIQSMERLRKSLDVYIDSLNLDPSFVKKEKQRLNYLIFPGIVTYPLLHRFRINDQKFEPDGLHYKFIRKWMRAEKAILATDVYQDGILRLSSQLASQASKKNKLSFLENQIDCIAGYLKDPEIVQVLVQRAVMSFPDYRKIENMDKILSRYNTHVTDPKMRAEFENLRNDWMGTAKGAVVPNFTYLDIDGKEVKLSDLKGKYVYIDFWATWCGPCRGELPHLQKLEEKYAGKDIYFVSISCDQDKSLWTKKVKDENLGGIQLHFGGDRDLMNLFKIKGIPHFVLIDKEGKVLEATMTRPSDPKTVEAFDKLLSNN